jgi:hypothetical protein
VTRIHFFVEHCPKPYDGAQLAQLIDDGREVHAFGSAHCDVRQLNLRPQATALEREPHPAAFPRDGAAPLAAGEARAP